MTITKKQAEKLAKEFDYNSKSGKIPIGIIYQSSERSLEEKWPQLKKQLNKKNNIPKKYGNYGTNEKRRENVMINENYRKEYPKRKNKKLSKGISGKKKIINSHKEYPERRK